MRELTFRHPDRQAVVNVLSCFGSLVGRRHDAGLCYCPVALDLLEAGSAAGDVQAMWEFVCKEAVPEEGDPHPRRASACCQKEGSVGLLTPGGVLLFVQYDPTGQGNQQDAFAAHNPWRMTVDFNRDSRRLASLILTKLWQVDEKTELLPVCTDKEHLTPLCLALSTLCIATMKQRMELLAKDKDSALPNGL